MRAAADVGGTFTDVLTRSEDGVLAFHKLLSTPPAYDQMAKQGALQHQLILAPSRMRHACGRRSR